MVGIQLRCHCWDSDTLCKLWSVVVRVVELCAVSTVGYSPESSVVFLQRLLRTILPIPSFLVLFRLGACALRVSVLSWLAVCWIYWMIIAASLCARYNGDWVQLFLESTSRWTFSWSVVVFLMSIRPKFNIPWIIGIPDSQCLNVPYYLIFVISLELVSRYFQKIWRICNPFK